jgi:prepilin-type N-terminal cleavage/methylation domain-containing protein
MSKIGRRAEDTERSGRSPSGFTLIEVAVTLVVMALVVTLVIPTFTRKSVARVSASDVVRSASRLALRRAEWMTLRVDERGGWDVHSDSQQETTALAQGVLERTEAMPFVVRLSPMGACLSNGMSAIAGVEDPCVAVARSARAPDARRAPQE